MKRFTAICAAILAAVVVISTVYAQEGNESKSSEENTFEYYASLDTGVQHVELNEDGDEIVYLIVVGKTTISTVFGKAKGRELAARKALNLCDGAVSKAFQRKVEVEDDAHENPVVVNTGGKEEGKLEMFDPVNIKTSSSTILRGMITLGTKVETNEEGESVYTMVRVYDSRHVDAFKKAYDKENSRKTPKNTRSSSVDESASGSPNTNTSVPEKKTFKSETHISPDASKYFK